MIFAMNRTIAPRGSSSIFASILYVVCVAGLCNLCMPTAVVADQASHTLKSVQDLVTAARTGVEYITDAQLKKRIAANPRLVLLDVRSKQEFDGGHLKGAAWVERGVAEFTLARQLQDPDAEIVVYCKVGNRTGLVVKSLREAGYRHVVGLDGGFDEWARKGNSIYNYLGEFKLVSLTQRDASSSAIDFYQDKSLP